MAGVNKNVSRGSGVKPGGKGHSFSSDVRLVQPLAAGRFARVADPDGYRSVHCETSSVEFFEGLRRLSAAGFGARVEQELQVLAGTRPEHGWVGVLRSAQEQGVFASEEVAS